MLVKEGETLHSQDMQDTIDELEDDVLSLCDLPLYSDQSVELEEDLSLESHGSTFSSSENDYFEFFSGDLNSSAVTTTAATTTTGFQQENIIFCGKLIRYKQPGTSENDSSRLLKAKKQSNDKKKRCYCLFKWIFSSKNGKRCTNLMHKKDHDIVQSSMYKSPKKTYSTNEHGIVKECAFPLHKMSILTSSSSRKAKWYLFLFGISRVSTEVDLRDIKSTRSRSQSSSTPPPPPPMFRFQNWEDKDNGGRKRGWGLWSGLIRVLSCGGSHH
ncbi:hypothetical protein BUALT_Bualt01G0103000 [Buddleja alternifolia]|uniref:Uncharacterized protein n=1 Tax=Buddleja alternifolia TaxID=168488 RepID=A0AAV6Y603_9LAMI|nr:hypothetical protein BUALT_Bualt01G0103000 [Buddleja alternifolia]